MLPPTFRTPVIHAMPVPLPALKACTLGRFQVWRGGEPLPASLWHETQVVALFKYLLCEPGFRASRDQLIDVFWPQASLAQARNRLAYTLSRLRTLLHGGSSHGQFYVVGTDWLQLTTDGDTRNILGDWVDWVAFEHAARGALQTRDAEQCRAALDLYGGLLLPEDVYADWAYGRRSELETLRLSLLLHLADISFEDAPAEAERCLRDALAADPAADGAGRTLMRQLASRGMEKAALDIYRNVELALAIEGLTPSEETRALHRQILGQMTIPGTQQNTTGIRMVMAVEYGPNPDLAHAVWEAVAAHGGARLPAPAGAGVLLASMGTPAECIDAACDVLRVMSAGGNGLVPRLALHAADLDHDPGAAGYAAVLSHWGASGQILLSQTAWALSRTVTLADTKLRVLGSYVIDPRLGPEIVAQVMRAGFPQRFPPLPANPRPMRGRQRGDEV